MEGGHPARLGRSSSADCLAARPERSGEMAAALAPPGNRTLIAHGGGRSYGDAALNTGGAVVLTGRLDRILSFDPSTGLLVSEPGVTFAELLAIFLPRGFIAPVSPGTGFVTLGVPWRMTSTARTTMASAASATTSRGSTCSCRTAVSCGWRKRRTRTFFVRPSAGSG
ncbi:FAD-binding protein [Paeniroseomonas aquatica]|uniref:FAD-binding protein n=1 Tax=Paeniroseomonas aquatica TaxID=373043 RepID=UPI00361E4CA9